MFTFNKSFVGAAMGTMVEYYDYALFSIFLPLLAPLFFPADTIYQSLVKGYVVLLLAMIARPLGGIFFGYIGDIYGRRKALLASIYGIAFATLAIGIMPTYETLGVLATLFFILAKSAQIFCFAGEYNGAGIYVVEHAKNKNEAYAGGALSAATLFGSLIASAIGLIVTFPFMPSWGWRIAFILGGLMGLFGIFYRKNLLESPSFEMANAQQQPLTNLIKHYPKELLTGIFIGGFATVPFTTVVTFITPVLMTKGYFTSQQFMLLQTFLSLVAVITLLAAGAIADKISTGKVMKAGSGALVLFSYPLLYLIDQASLLFSVLALTTIIILNEIFLAPSHAYLKNLFPMSYRYRGSSLSFAFGMSLWGGLTPVIESYLYQTTGKFSATALWLALIGMGAFFTIHGIDKKT